MSSPACHRCGHSVSDGASLRRVNEKGVPARWRCLACLGRTAASTMKRVMSRRERHELTPGDAAEVEKFKQVLRDMPTMTLDELADKHGHEYLGLTPTASEADQPATPQPR